MIKENLKILRPFAKFAQNASAPEERDHLLDLARQWRTMAISPRIYEVPPRDAHRSAVTTWLKGNSIIR